MEDYVKGIEIQYKTGHAKEHAYRPDLKLLFEKVLEGVIATNDPKRSEHGAPDFIFTKGEMILGYAEAKDITVDLSVTSKGEQLKRYFGYSNLILTNYIEFRFYRNGEEWCDPTHIGEIKDGSVTWKPENFGILTQAIKDFYSQTPEKIKSGVRLTKIMGGRARRIRDNVSKYLEEESDKNLDILKMFDVIKKNLVHDITHIQFADMYAQTLVYGLFVARYHDESSDTFSRQEARDLIPASNPFLQHFFDHLAGASFDKRLRYIVDELCEIFAVSNVKEILSDYKKDRDPVIHFYEDFLFEYDNDLRKKMGVFYTPAPVVSFIVRAVDQILKKDFGLVNGLADTSKVVVEKEIQGKKKKIETHKVQVLDPATGTGTFLNEVVKYIYENNFSQEKGLWSSYVAKDLLPRIHGFELMMASYTIAHLKLGMTLRDTGVTDFSRRIGVYLTNSLEEGKVMPDDLFGSFGLMDTITHESSEAARIKTEYPVMVVIGNPPYSGVSSNNFEHANRLVDKYKFEAGGTLKLQERNPKWLNDDYVKFIALAEDLVLQNNEGVLAFITNHSYLDNPTFRGMRWHLAETFSEIYIVDLHGNAKKKEVNPDGGKDENVFDIQQGVSIMIGVRKKNKDGKKDAKVFVCDLFGKREAKFDSLVNGGILYKEIELDPYQYYFTHKNNKGRDEYEKGFSVHLLFKNNSAGIITGDDEKYIKYTEFEYYQDTELGNYLWRPLDFRYINYDKKNIGRSRYKIMSHLEKTNLAFLFTRTDSSPAVFSNFFLTKYLTDGHALPGLSYVAPLYLYDQDGSKTPNLDKEIWGTINKITGETSPENILDYIYAVLHSLKYRETYREFLKIDFPRVKYPKNEEEFWNLVSLGTKLRELHLLEATELQSFNLGITFVGEGENVVEKPVWKDGKVYLNKDQYFDGVEKEVYEFYIGGYQPAQKWLKDRKGRILTADDIFHYKKMCIAMKRTIEIMKEVDSLLTI